MVDKIEDLLNTELLEIYAAGPREEHLIFSEYKKPARRLSKASGLVLCLLTFGGRKSQITQW